MRHPHMSSGGRYPALRTIAVLYLIGAVCVVGLCIWQAVRVVAYGQNDETTLTLFGPATTPGTKAVVVICWLAVAFIGLIGMLAIAELIKLFIDIEHNTRMAALAGPATATTTAAGTNGTAAIDEGPAVPFIPGRKLLEGDETAEGALLRGH